MGKKKQIPIESNRIHHRTGGKGLGRQLRLVKDSAETAAISMERNIQKTVQNKDYLEADHYSLSGEF